MTIIVPTNFTSANDELTKQVVVVVEIDGVPDILTSAPVGTRIKYGDPIKYGDLDPATGQPYNYGGLRAYVTPEGGTYKQYLSFSSSSLTISQRLEPEQGRASISQLNLGFIDKDGYMSNLIAPGNVVPEILGRNVRVWLGYQNIAYPQDYRLVFRGKIQNIDSQAGVVILNLADPNLIRRQQIFYQATTPLNGSITDVATTIPVTSNGDFHKKILGPNGAYDTSVKLYIKIENEYIQYQQTGSEATGFGANQFVGVLRGQRGTTAAVHADQSTVTSYAEISGQPVEMALKIMLSGWNGPWKENVTIVSIVYTGDPDVGDVPGGVVLTKDAVLDYGLAIGDYITITGDGNAPNNTTVVITDFGDVNNGTNNLVFTSGTATLVSSPTSSGLAAFRSQYDTYPVSFGMQMDESDVDVASHVTVINSFTSSESMRFFIRQPQNNGKDFIEKELFLPISAYSLTRQGQVSIKMTIPPFADERLKFLTSSVLTKPTNFRVVRGTSNRTFFNEIQFTYDFDDDGNATTSFRDLDTDSLNSIGVSAILPMASEGTRSDLTGLTTIQTRATRFLQRYKKGAVQLMVNAFFGIGADAEAGDIVAVQDDGTLQISNMSTGKRNLGTQLFEITNKALDIKSGVTSLTLLSGLNFSIQDVFASFAPSSNINSTGSSTTVIKIIKSFGFKFGNNEYKKWLDYIGNHIRIWKSDYSVSYDRVLTAVSINNFLTVDSALPVTPDNNYFVELSPYSTDPSTSPYVDLNSKLIHCYFDRTTPVTSGTSQTVFNVGAGDVQFFRVGYPVYLFKTDLSVYSPEVLITDVTGTQITVGMSLGFTPSTSYKVELGSWYDGRGAYRWV